MDEHTRTLLAGVLIAAGLTEIVVSDEDWKRALECSLADPKTTGDGGAIRFSLTSKALSLDSRRA